MNTYLGVDLGTSGVKVLLVSAEGKILAEKTENYPITYLNSGWSEQAPAEWLRATESAIDEIFFDKSFSREDVKGLSFGGQMHGLVILDEKDEIIRPAILWNDGRTAQETDYLNNVIGKKKLSTEVANIAFAGFTAPKILWVKNNEPENFKKIKKICLPKDFLAYMMTGVFSTDYSDASGTLLLDVKNKRWSNEMCKICGIKEQWLPKLYNSYDVIGKLKEKYGMPNALVTAGAGDNAAAAIGTGTVQNGDCNISLGTSGTVFVASETFAMDNKNAMHSFLHASGKWSLMACILSAASANKWWVEDVLKDDYAKSVNGVESMLGDNNLYFLPYLMGERSPHNDINARGAFIGMRPNTTKEQMSLAVLEGVAFALKDSVMIAKENGINISSTKICGGGAKSALWKKIIANVLNVDVCSVETEQGPGYGAAILAMVGAGEYDSLESAANCIVKIKEVVKPKQHLVDKYQLRYQVFKCLYPALKKVFKQMND